MAIAFVSAGSIDQANGGSHSFSFTVPTGHSNTILFVLAGSFASGFTCSYAGQAMTEAASTAISSVTIKIFYLLNPPTGANTVSLASGATHTFGGCLVYSGVVQTSPIDATAGSGSQGSSTTMEYPITTIADNAWVVGVVRVGFYLSSGFNANGSTRIRASLNDSSNPIQWYGATMDGGPKSPAGSITIGGSKSTTDGSWGMVLASFKEVPPPPPKITMNFR